MTQISFSEAKAHLSKYGAMAATGQSTIVMKHRRPAFRITSVDDADQPKPKRPGIARGRMRMADDFDITPDSVIHAFEGNA